jgi:hypothetical protein
MGDAKYDTFMGHPGATIIAPAIAIGETLGAGGKELINSLAAAPAPPAEKTAEPAKPPEPPPSEDLSLRPVKTAFLHPKSAKGLLIELTQVD